MYKRFENETDEELIYRITSDKELIGSWQKVADILNELLGTNYTESKFRKERQYFDRMYNSNQKKLSDTDEQIEELEQKKRELERAKIQFRDERNAWQKQNYSDARVEQRLDYLEDIIRRSCEVKYPVNQIAKTQQIPYCDDKTMMICLSDLHIGATYDSIFGKYNSDIAKERLDEYLQKIEIIREMNCISKAFVVGLGDLVSGNIHYTIAVTNRENVIQQVIKASELVSDFLYKLTNMFDDVCFANVSGNHSRITSKKDDSMKDERLDDLISWYICNSLKHIPNFHSVSSNETSLNYIQVEGLDYYICHGDYDSFSKRGLSNLVLATGKKPAGVLFGHYHTPAMEVISDVYMVRSGCLGGSGDDYCVQKRLTGKPSQTVLICDSNGVQCMYPVILH